MRILHTADWHVGRSIRGRNRLEEQRDVLGELVQACEDEICDLVIVSGDLFEHSVPSPEAEELVYAALLGFAETGARVVLIPGNHDNPKRLQAVAPLLQRAGSILAVTRFSRPEEGGCIELESRTGEVARIAMWPFLPKRTLIRSAELMEQEAADHSQSYREAFSRVAGLFEGHFSADTVNLAVAHVMVDQAETVGGERDVHSLFDYSVPASLFSAPRLQYVALGHVHKCQPVPAGCPAWYSGSTLQLEFGDPEPTKHYLVVDVEPGLPAEVQPRALQSGRRLRRIQGKLDRLEASRNIYGEDYLQVILEDEPRPGLAREARELLPNVIDVRITEPESPSGDIDPLPEGPPEKLFEEFLREKGRENDSLVTLFKEILEEVYET